MDRFAPARALSVIALLCVAGSSRAVLNTWIGPNGWGFWDVTTNWLLGLPSITHDVRITGDSIATEHRTGTTTINSLVSACEFELSGGVLTLNSAAATSQVDTRFTLSGGTLTGSGTIVLYAPTSEGNLWSSGSILQSGATNAKVVVQNNLAISGAGTRILDRILENNGVTYFDPGQSIRAQTTLARLNNNLLGTVILENGSGLLRNGTQAGTVNNVGILRKEGYDGTATVDWIIGGNSGTIYAQAGRLKFLQNVTSTGTITGDVGTVIEFAAGTHNITGSASTMGQFETSGTATLNFNGGFVDADSYLINGGTTNFGTGTIFGFAPVLTIGGGTVNFNTGSAKAVSSVALASGTLAGNDGISVNGYSEWTGGTLSGGKITFNDELVISGSSAKSLSRVLEAKNRIVYRAPVTSTVNGRLDILAGGKLEIFTDDPLLSAGSTINNYGDIIKIGDAGTDVPATLNNFGLIDISSIVATRRMRFLSGGSHTGNFVGASASIFDFTAGNHTSTGSISVGKVEINGANLTQTGSISASVVELNSGSLSYNGASPSQLSDLRMNGGTVGGSGEIQISGSGSTWSGVSLTGTGKLVNGGTLLLGPASGRKTSKTIENNGTLYLTGGTVEADPGGQVVNSAGANTYVIGGSQLTTSNPVNGYLNNLGTFSKLSSGPGDASAFESNWRFDNNGTVNLQAGTFRFSANGAHTGSFNGVLDTTYEFPSGLHEFTGGAFNTLGTIKISQGASTPILRFNGTSVSSGTTLNLIFGTIGGAGTLTLNGTTNWTGGTMGEGVGTTVNNGTISMSQNPRTVSRELHNFGTISMSAGSLAGAHGAHVVNQSTGTFTVNDDSDFTSGSGFVGTFDNYGLLKKAAGAGETTMYWTFNNSGTLEIASGEFTLNADGLHSGNVIIGDGARLSTKNLGTVQHMYGSLESDGTLFLNMGTLNYGGTSFNSNSIILSGGTLNFMSGAIANLNRSTVDHNSGFLSFATGNAAFVRRVNLNGGSASLDTQDGLTISQMLDWKAGYLQGLGTTKVSGTLAISGTDTKFLRSILEVSGTGTHVGSPLRIDTNNSQLIIKPTGVLEIQNGADITQTPGIVGDLVNVKGTLRKDASATTTEVFSPMRNSGTVEVLGGNFDIRSTTATPMFSVANSTLDEGKWRVHNGGAIGFPGLAIRHNKATIELFGANSRLRRVGGADALDSQLRINDGVFRMTGSNLLTTDLNFINNGELTVSTAQPITFKKDVSNNGLTNSATGQVNVLNGSTATSLGKIVNAGAITVSSGASGASTLTATFAFEQTAGTTTVTGTSSISALAGFSLDGGILTGDGLVSGALTNKATIRPGASVGQLRLTGNYTQNALGLLEMDVASLTSFDQLAITGTASLAGALKVNFLGGFSLSTGQRVRILTSTGARGGTFANLSATGTTKTLKAYYFANYVEIGLSPYSGGTVGGTTGTYGGTTNGSGGNGVVPEPGTFLAIGTGLLSLMYRAKSRQ